MLFGKYVCIRHLKYPQYLWIHRILIQNVLFPYCLCIENKLKYIILKSYLICEKKIKPMLQWIERSKWKKNQIILIPLIIYANEELSIFFGKKIICFFFIFRYSTWVCDSDTRSFLLNLRALLNSSVCVFRYIYTPSVLPD